MFTIEHWQHLKKTKDLESERERRIKNRDFIGFKC